MSLDTRRIGTRPSPRGSGERLHGDRTRRLDPRAVHDAAEVVVGSTDSNERVETVEGGALVAVDGCVAAVGSTDDLTTFSPVTGPTEAFGASGRSAVPGVVPAYSRPQVCEAKGPFRWLALSGDPADIHRIDEAERSDVRVPMRDRGDHGDGAGEH